MIYCIGKFFCFGIYKKIRLNNELLFRLLIKRSITPVTVNRKYAIIEFECGVI
jgi:hypothetical protein